MNDVLCGVRFRLTPLNEEGEPLGVTLKARIGAGSTIVLDAEIISGPITRRHDGHTNHWWAECNNCGIASHDYAKRNTPTLRAWAHQHRCEVAQ